MNELPASEDFMQLTLMLLKVEEDIDWSDGGRAEKVWYMKDTPFELLDYTRYKLPASAEESVERSISSSAAGMWITSNEAYPSITAALARQAKRKPMSMFPSPLAKYWLIAAISAGLSVWTRHIVSGTKPRAPGVDDWRAGREAVESLIKLTAMGVDLTKPIGLRGQLLPPDWLFLIRESLAQAENFAAKPHSDSSSVDRAAAKAFALLIWRKFDAVPPTLVERFGEMINYRSAALSTRHLPDWIRLFESGSVADVLG